MTLTPPPPLPITNLTFLLLKSRFFCRPIHARASKFQSLFRPWSIDVTVRCPPVRLSVLSIDSSSDVQLLCRSQGAGRRSRSISAAGARAQQRAASVNAVNRGGGSTQGDTNHKQVIINGQSL